MSGDLVLKSSCSGCGTASDLYGSNCKHMTLCLACGKSMAETHAACSECGVPVTRLIREYNVRPSNISDKSYFIGRFVQGLPTFSKKKGSEAKWSLHKEGLKGRQLTDALREKYKNKSWILEDETCQQQCQGQLEGAQHANLGCVPRLTRAEWGVIRSSLGKPRRLSERFLQEERKKLEKYRESVCDIHNKIQSGDFDSVPVDLALPSYVGQKVIACHPTSREIHHGSILAVDQNKFRAQFDRPELGIEFVLDNLELVGLTVM